MKIYVDAADYEVYTEENINEKIIQRIEDDNYEGLLSYIVDNFTEPEIFAMLSPNSQLTVLEYLKESRIDSDFYEREVNEPSPCDKCPYKK